MVTLDQVVAKNGRKRICTAELPTNLKSLLVGKKPFLSGRPLMLSIRNSFFLPNTSRFLVSVRPLIGLILVSETKPLSLRSILATVQVGA